MYHYKDANIKFEYINLLKTIAIILITNSHFKPIYEGLGDYFAFGGAMGCAIFFFCSGYTLANSKLETFEKWMKKRVLRLYPSLWLMNVILLFKGKELDLLDFVFPYSYWFLRAIILFYILFYFVRKYFSKYKYGFITLLLLIPFGVTYYCSDYSTWMIDYAYHPYLLHYYYYFMIMLLGSTIRNSNINNIKLKLNNNILLLLSILSFIGTYSLKFLMQTINGIEHIQLFFPIGLIITVLLLFVYSIKESILKHTYIHIFVNFVSKITLEIYLVQFVIIDFCSKIGNMYIRFFSTIILIVLCAYILFSLSKKISTLMHKC